MSEVGDISSRLRDAAKRAKWYQTGEWGLLLAAAEEIERKEREMQEAEARGAERERVRLMDGACSCEHDEVLTWGEHVIRRDCACRIDADHAVAIERERIAAWLDKRALDHRLDASGCQGMPEAHALATERAGLMEYAAQAIRAGKHHEGNEGL